MPRRRNSPAASPPSAITPSRSGAGVPVSSAWALVGVLASAAVSTPAVALAQSSTTVATESRTALRDFAIPAGHLDSALAAFSRVTGVTVTDPSSLLGGVTTSGASGRFTTERALHALLTGTGLTYRFTNVRALRIERGALPSTSGDRVATLSGVTVMATSTPAVSSAKYTAPLRDVPQTVTIIPQDVIVKQGATSLRDVVRNVPSITMNAGEGGTPPGDNFNVRGFSARTDLFVNGVRDIGGYNRDAFNLEQVEVAEGPASAYTGRGSTGGSINIVTKTPHLEAVRSVTGIGGTASQGRGTADVNIPFGTAGGAFRINGMISDGNVAGNDRLHNSAWGIAPSLAVGLGTATQLLVSYSRSGQDNVPAYGVSSQDSVPRVDTRHFFGLPTLDFEHVAASDLTARVDHERGSFHLRSQLTRAASNTGRIVTSANLTNGVRGPKTHVSEDVNVTSQTNLTIAIDKGPVPQNIATGFEISRENSLFGHYTITGAPPAVRDLNNPDPELDYHPIVTLTPNARRVDATSVGAYLFDTFKLGQHVELNGGARWDHFVPTFRDSISRDVPSASMVSGRLGIVVKPAEHGSIYAAYGTSFNPSIQNLSTDGLNTLPPEKNRSVELGTKWSVLKNRLLATFALFRTEKTNARTPDPLDPSVNILAGKQRVQGAEVSASGALSSRWHLLAGYSHLESKILESGNAAQVGSELANTPKHAANVWTTYVLPAAVEIGVGARYVDRRFLRGTTYVPGYRTYDAVLSKSFGRQVGLRLNVYNLTDELYYDNGRFWVPAPSRSATLATTLTF